MANACTEVVRDDSSIRLTLATANVNTLAPGEVRQAQELGQGLLVSGKIQWLENSFFEAGYDFVGVQETRIQNDADVKKNRYHVLGSSATEAGTHGAQLWIALRIKAKLIECIPASPRLLLVVVRVRLLSLVVVVAHAPINGDADAAQYFADLAVQTRMLRSKFPDAFLAVLADFNARIGSVPSDGIGEHGAEQENLNGEHLRAFLIEHNLAALNTLHEEAAGFTWTGSRGHHSRIDYVLWPIEQLFCVQGVRVNRQIELTDSERDDHNVVDFSVVVVESHSSVGVKESGAAAVVRPTRLCKYKLVNPALQQQFVDWMWTYRPDPEATIDAHLKTFQDHLRAGASAFANERKQPRKSWLSQRSWDLMCFRDNAKKRVRAAWAAVRAADIRLVFLSWAALAPAKFLLYHTFGEIIRVCAEEQSVRRRWAIVSSVFNHAVNASRRCIKADKAAFLDNLAAQADMAADCGDNGAIYQLAKRAAGVRSRIMKVVEWEDGSLTTSVSQYAQRFQDHFAGVFSAKIIQNLNELGIAQPRDTVHSPSQSPSVQSVEKAIWELPSGKAVGPDRISAELLKIALAPCSVFLHGLLQKVWSYAYWPLDWRSGRLQELHKKGSTRVCDNFRGLLISDHLGKAASSVLYEPIDGPYHAYVPPAQCGAVKSKSGDLATHLLRTMLDIAAASCLSIVILFVDLVKAFDRVLREIVLGWPQSGASDGVQYLIDMGFNSDQAADLAREIANGTVLDEMRVHPHVKMLLASMHTGSWFQVAGSNELLVVGKGGRQGCRFGGVLFNLAYARALKRLYERADAEGIPVKLRYDPDRTPGADMSNTDRVQETIVFDVTFVDDEAIVITASVPTTLTRKFRRAVQLLIETFERYGMSINWKPGKTEAMVIYRGKHAKSEKCRLATSESTSLFRVFPDRAEEDDVQIHVVPEYKHLGSIIAASGSLVPEARQRARSAMNAFAPLAMKVFGSKSVGIQRRITLGWSLVVSRLFFNVHVWSKFAGKARSIINGMYMRLWRRIGNDPRYRRTKWTDREVRLALSIPSVDCYARKRRLCYFSRLARTDFDALHAALQSRGKLGEQMPWVSLIEKDIAVLRDNAKGKLDELPSNTHILIRRPFRSSV